MSAHRSYTASNPLTSREMVTELLSIPGLVAKLIDGIHARLTREPTPGFIEGL